MELTDKTVICIIPFVESIYSKEEVEFMLPGIIQKYFQNKDILFDELVYNSIGGLMEDKGGYLLKEAHYEMMNELIGNYLVKVGYDELFTPLLDTHDITDIRIDPIWTIFVTFEPKYDHKDIAQVKFRDHERD